MDSKSSAPARPQHRKTLSSKSNILRSLVSSKSRPESGEVVASSTQNERVQTVPLLPPDHPFAARDIVLGERQLNSRSPHSPSKSRQKGVAPSRTSHDLRSAPTPNKPQDGFTGHQKSKSSTNLAGMFAKMNRSNKDLSRLGERDKENTTPPSTVNESMGTPIWAQFASSVQPNPRPATRRAQSSYDVQEEIAKYTPQEYSPSKQRNFNGTFEEPRLRPTLSSRPQSAALGSDIIGAVGRRLSGDRTNFIGRSSEDGERRKSKDGGRRMSGERTGLLNRNSTDRQVSGSSTEPAAGEGKLTIAKRGGRVMAAVAAFQGKSKGQQTREEGSLDEKAVNEAFEAVLDSRNVPEAMRHKMRSLTMRVKADFIKQDQAGASPPGTADGENSNSRTTAEIKEGSQDASRTGEDDGKASKRSRPRSRTFTFSKADKNGGDSSPSKKQRSRSKTRPISMQHSKETSETSPTTPVSPGGRASKKGGSSATPVDFIAYLRQNQNPCSIEVGRIHKLRILLRNETVAWVDSFVSLGGMTEIIDLLHRIMGLEWRDEHEDQLLHETLLCLKGLCTTERAMAELEKVADALFPAFLAMLFDDERKGPAEYTTRTIITTVLFNFLASATRSSPESLEHRARQILKYLGEPPKPEEARPVDFVLDMHVPRPYRLWCREVTYVTKEVFWIFLHSLNVIPLPKKTDDPQSDSTFPTVTAAETLPVHTTAYTHRHFPGSRPPVPAAPYIGGVEWDATTYLTSHLDLLNGLVASLPTAVARNSLRADLRASGFEKTLGTTLRTCKEKFYTGVHDALRAWVAAAAEDGWDTRFVREGPSVEEQATRGASPTKSPAKAKKNKADDPAPFIEAPAIDAVKMEGGLGLGLETFGEVGGKINHGNEDEGWLG